MNEEQPEQIRWNNKYSEIDLDASTGEPSHFLVAQESYLRDLPKGSALDIACGAGRNSFYLADFGFDVDAVDISDVVIGWLIEEAASREVILNPIQLDLTKEPFPKERYQLIISFRYLQRNLFQPVIDALLPGGLLIFETMHQDYVEKLGHKMNPEFLLGDNELLDAFRGLRILHYAEGVKMSEGSEEQTALASLVAMKM